jgi:stage III sporulation protein AD
MMQPLVSFMSELAAGSALGEVAALLFRGLGIAYLTQLCADFCRQSGEGQIAAGVESAGRIQLLLLSLSPLRQLIETAGQLLQSW